MNPYIQYTKTTPESLTRWETSIQFNLQENLDKFAGRPFAEEAKIIPFDHGPYGGRGFEVNIGGSNGEKGPFTARVSLKIEGVVLAIIPRLFVPSFGASKSSESNVFLTCGCIGWGLLAGIEEFCAKNGFVESPVPVSGGLEGG